MKSANVKKMSNNNKNKKKNTKRRNPNQGQMVAISGRNRATYNKSVTYALPNAPGHVGLQSSWLQGMPGGSAFLGSLGKNWYMDALVDPLSVPAARFPGDISTPTSVYKSVRVMDVTVNPQRQGRFTVFVTPRLGSQDVIDNFSIYIGAPGFPYGQPDLNRDTRWYASGVGSNARIDPNAILLTSSSSDGVYITSSTIPATVSGNRCAFFGDAEYSPGQGGNTVRFTTGKGTSAQSNYSPYGITYKTVRPTLNSPERASVFFLDAGEYIVQIDVNPLTANDTDFRFASGTGVLLEGDIDATGQAYNGVPKVRSSYTQAEGRKASFRVTIPGSAAAIGQNWFSMQTDLAPVPSGANQPYAWGYIQRVSQTEVSNLGVIKTIRPVACSALLTYIGTDFNNGGSIAAAFVPPETQATNYLNNNLSANDVGELDYHNYTAITRIPGSYSGPLRTGAYSFWTPAGVEQYKFRTPTDHVSANYGGMVFAGNWSPNAELNDSIQLRLTVVTHYEYTTTSLLFPSVYSPLDPIVFNQANQLLTAFPRAMPNDDHLRMIDKIRAVAKKGLGFISKAAPIALSLL